MDLIPAKQQVRRELKRTAERFSQRYVEAASRAVCRSVLQSREFLQAETIFGYLAFQNEISVDELLQEALRLGKTVAVPRIVSKTEMQAATVNALQELPLDCYGIRTAPLQATVIPPDAFDLILVPGAGFSVTGCRMGRGAGYYDRFLAQTKGFRLGITCEKLIKEDIPMAAHDCRVQALVTETRFIRCM